MADDVLRLGVQGVSDLITKPGLINLDFADVKSIMKGMGMAFMGTGIASGENRAAEAATKAISSPLLIDTSIKGARGILINITGGKDLTLHEVDKASRMIFKMAHPEANIIFGAVIDPAVKDMVKVTVIATGFERDFRPAFVVPLPPKAAARPLPRRTPPAVPAPRPLTADTPPFPFVPLGQTRFSRGQGEMPAAWDRAWDEYDTPSYIRNRHSQLRKN
jgi:cell division protein FtsZ